MEYEIGGKCVDNGLTKRRHGCLIRDEYEWRAAESAVVFHGVSQIKRVARWNPNLR